MISQRFASAVGLSAVVAILLLAGCGSLGVALGMRTRLDKLPITAVSATLSPHPGLTPGKSGRLIIVATGSDGKTWTTVGPGSGTVLFDSFTFESTVVKVKVSGVVSLPSDPRVSSGKTAHVHVAVVGHPDVVTDLDIPLQYNVAYAAHFSGASGNDGFDGTDGVAGLDGTSGSIDPNNPQAGGNGSNGSSGSDGGAIYEYDQQTETFLLRATQNLDAELVELLRSTFIRKGEGAMGRMALTREPVQIPDILQDATYQSRVREIVLRTGYRALLAVPLLRESGIIGGLVINRKTPGEFAPDIIELLRTFATQSALAIQNARLFQEIEEKSRQLEIADRHKSEFLASMSHELRTPLNAVIGFSEVLLERMFGEINAKQDEYLQDILSSGRHLLSLINDILDLAKIEAGRMELDVADFHLPQAIDNAVTLVRERAARRAITLEVGIDPQLGEIKGDERKVKQVLLNLLSNAIKFTPEGGRIDVRAAVRERRHGGGVCRGHRGRHRSRGSGGGVRGIPASGDGGQEGRGHRARAGPFPEVHRAAWRADLGDEPGRDGLDIHVHDPGALRAERSRRRSTLNS